MKIQKKTTIQQRLSKLLIVTLTICCLFFIGATGGCEDVGTFHMSDGAVCAAEQAGAPAFIGIGIDYSVPKTELFMFLALAIIALTHVLKQQSRLPAIIRFWKTYIETGFGRHGPFSKKLFIPYFFATHGL